MKILYLTFKIHCLIWLLFLLSNTLAWSQQNQNDNQAKGRILVIDLNKLNFTSNVYYPDELAKLNDTAQADVVPLYLNKLKDVLATWQSENFKFVFANEAESDKLTRNALYKEWNNFFDESYIALVADSSIDAQIQQLAAKYQVDYVLALNYYEIHSNSPPAYFEPNTRAMHSIHYDLFDRQMRVASSGVITMYTRDSRAGSMRNEYESFASTLLNRLTIYETAPTTKDLKKQYYKLQVKETSNLWGFGISTGWGMPYGVIGLELVRNIGSQADINAGLGYARSGLKAGAGFRYYLIGQGSKMKPFVGANFSWASGNTISMGGRTDDKGNQLDPDDVSQFKIRSDRAIHYKVGFRLLTGRQALLFDVGHAMSFKGYKAVYISGKDTPQRRRRADLMTVGGLELGMTYIIYLGK